MSYTLGMLAAQSGCVLICLAGWLDGVLGRDVCRLITWAPVPPSNNTSRERRPHSEKCVQHTPLKCCARPSSLGHFKARRGSDSLSGAQSSWPPFLVTTQMQKKKGVNLLVFHQSLLFRPRFPKLQAAIGDHTKKNGKFTFLFILEFFWGPLFCLFFVLFLP